MDNITPTDLPPAVSSPITAAPLPNADKAMAAKALGGLDELFQYLNTHWFYKQVVTWTTAQLPPTVLWSHKISPLDTCPVIETVASLFRNWVGSLNYGVTISANSFYGGKLLMVYLPPGIEPTSIDALNQWTVFPHIIIDIKTMGTTHFSTPDLLAQKFHSFPPDRTTITKEDEYAGTMCLVVYTAMVANTAATISSVNIAIQINAANMDFGFIMPPNPTATIRSDPISFGTGQPIDLGDTYSGLVVLSQSAFPNAGIYLDGVYKADGSYFAGEGFKPLAPWETVTIPLTGTSKVTYGLPMPRLRGNFLNRALIVGGPTGAAVVRLDTVEKRDDSQTGMTLFYTWEYNDLTQLPTLQWNVTSYADFSSASSHTFPQDSIFQPKGTTAESLVMFQGNIPLNMMEFGPINNALYWQVSYMLQKYDVPEGQALFGTVKDALTSQTFAYFKLYYEGFMTTSAMNTTTVYARTFIFEPQSLVPENYPMPLAPVNFLAARLLFDSDAFQYPTLSKQHGRSNQLCWKPGNKHGSNNQMQSIWQERKNIAADQFQNDGLPRSLAYMNDSKLNLPTVRYVS